MTQPPLPSYLTTREVAGLLRIKERRVYDLVASGEIPHSRATGKLLFPREAVLRWISGETAPAVPSSARPPVVLGSHDPLLDWALRESGAGLAAYFDGSRDGLDRFAAGEGIAAGSHLREADAGTWNVATVADRFGDDPVVLMEWAWRQRGLIVPAGNPLAIHRVGDLAGRRMTGRQSGAGSRQLLDILLAEAGLDRSAIVFVEPPARDETEAALSVLEGRSDVTFGLQSLAAKLGLDFAPIVEERFDLLIDRRAWFEPPFQTLLAFCRSPTFAEKARELGGYKIAGFGKIHFNGG